MSIIQRWVAAKERIQTGVVHAASCVIEARSIVRQKCGQEIFNGDYWVQVQIDGNVWVKRHMSGLQHTLFFTSDGSWKDGISSGFRPVREQHLPFSLREAEALADCLHLLTTGAVIAEWETKELSR